MQFKRGFLKRFQNVEYNGRSGDNFALLWVILVGSVCSTTRHPSYASTLLYTLGNDGNRIVHYSSPTLARAPWGKPAHASVQPHSCNSTLLWYSKFHEAGMESALLRLHNWFSPARAVETPLYSLPLLSRVLHLIPHLSSSPVPFSLQACS